LLEAYFGGQFQSPQIGGLVEGTGTLVQQGPQLFGLLSRESGVDGVGTRGTFVEAAQAEAVESADGVANRLLVGSQVVGNPWGAFPSDAGQQNLAAAQSLPLYLG
jgi:hypothetical protein